LIIRAVEAMSSMTAGRTHAQRIWTTIPTPIKCMTKGNF